MLKGDVSILDLEDPTNGMTLRVADYGLPLALKVLAYLHIGEADKAREVDNFNWQVLETMDLPAVRDNGETPFYYWLKAMKVQNRLSFEDGIYTISENLASSIVRCKEAKQFVLLLGGGKEA